MRRAYSIVIPLFLTGLAALSLHAERNESPAAFRTGLVLLAFHNGVTQAQQNAILLSAGLVEVKRIGVGVHVVAVNPGHEVEAIQLLKSRPEIRYAEPDFLHFLAAGTLPNDTSAGNQWAMQNTGQTVNSVQGTPGADQRTPLAWGITTGTNSVVVAILDSGVEYTHPDLATNMWNNPGGIGGCAAGTHGFNVLNGTCDPMDDEVSYGGHGTHVAGIAGAVGNNAAGVSGVNWTTSIMAVKWFPATGSGSTSDLITAMDWVVQAKQAGVNVRVANDSATWPGTGFSQALSDEIDLLGGNDILLTTAAGNTAQNDDTIPRYPCSYDRPNMICVGASDQNDNLWSSSNFGTTTVKLAAPGANVYSTLRQNNYGYISGCSMAAPQVAGTAALILSLGYQTVANLKSLIMGGVDPLPSLTNYVATGGRLNVCKAVPGCVSAATAVPAVTALPGITGIPQFGSTLGVSTGTWSGNPTSYTYQWLRCPGGANCAPIPGATSSSYATLASADVGSALAVTVTASNASGSSPVQSTLSSPTSTASSPFVVTSGIQDGQTIGGSVTWQATPAQAVNFAQFYIDGVLRQTVSSSPYTYNQGTTGTLDTTTLSSGAHVLGIRTLSANNLTYGFYGATVTVANQPKNTSLPVISGTPSQGQTVTSSIGSWSNSPSSYSYQWNRCAVNGSNCAAIPGATGGSYIVTSADASSSLRSAVTAVNAWGSGTALSAPVVVGVSGGSVPIALLQSNGGQGSAVGALSLPFPSATTAGNLIVAFVRMSSSSQTVQITDSLGNAYSDAVNQVQTTDGHQVHIFYAPNILGGANTVTATFSSTNNHPFLAIYEYSGLKTTNPLDRTAHAQGSSASVNSGPTAVTSSANELVFAGAGFPSSYGGAVTAGSGYTLQQQDTATSRGASEAAIAGSASAWSGTFNLSASTDWSAIVATFIGSATVSGPPSVSTTSLPNGQQNVAYNATLAATGGVTPYTWSIVSGALPAGLSLTASNGVISGTPTGSGTSSFTVQVMDAQSQTATRAETLTIGPKGASPITLLQSNAVEGSGVGSVSIPFPSANTAGNLIVAFVRMSSSSQTVQLTDSLGNVYTKAVTQVQSADGHQVHILYAPNIVGGFNTVTATFSSTNNHPFLAIYEYSGIRSTSPLDRIASAQGSSASPNSGATAITSSANELVFAGTGFPYSYGGTLTAGSGYTLQRQDTGTSRSASETAIASSTGAWSGTFSLSASTNWSAVVATFIGL